MLILLPPSEGKDAPASGKPLRLGQLSFPELTGSRERLTQALSSLCQRQPAKARTALGISARQVDQLERNAELLSAPAGPAWQVYSGVLYDALDLHSASARQMRRARSDIVIASALFGLLLIDDAIPAYRLSADSVLPGVGRLTEVWRPGVSAAIEHAAGRGIVLDLRSSAYVALGPVPPAMGERTAVARVLQERRGKRTVVSHHNKATKGRLVRALLDQRAPRTVEALVASIAECGYRVEANPPARPGSPWTLDVVVIDL